MTNHFKYIVCVSNDYDIMELLYKMIPGSCITLLSQCIIPSTVNYCWEPMAKFHGSAYCKHRIGAYPNWCREFRAYVKHVSLVFACAHLLQSMYAGPKPKPICLLHPFNSFLLCLYICISFCSVFLVLRRRVQVTAQYPNCSDCYYCLKNLGQSHCGYSAWYMHKYIDAQILEGLYIVEPSTLINKQWWLSLSIHVSHICIDLESRI